MASTDKVLRLLMKVEDKELRDALTREVSSIKEFKKQCKEGKKETSQFFDGLTSKLGINVKALAGWGAAITAGKVALKVLKDSLQTTESQMDTWASATMAAKSTYEGFLQALNNQDITGYLNRMGDIVSAAREAYNALDELETLGTIRSPERMKLQARATELKAIIRRQGKNSEAGKAAQAELKRLEPQLTASYKSEAQDNYKTFELLVKNRLKEGGISLRQKDFNTLMASFSSEELFKDWRSKAKGSVRRVREGGEGYSRATIKTVDDRNLNQKLLDLFTDEWRKENSKYLTAAYSSRQQAASNLLGDARYVGVSATGGKGGGGITKAVKEVVKEEKSAVDELIAYVNDPVKALELQLQKSEQALKQAQEDEKAAIQASNEELARQQQMYLDNEAKAQEMSETYRNDLASAVYNVGDAFSALGGAIGGATGDMIAWIGRATESIQSLISNYSQLMVASQAAATAKGIESAAGLLFPYNLAAMGTVITTIASLFGGLPKFANGGIVGGSSFSGDHNLIAANSGEMYLSRSQQARLFNMINGGAGSREVTLVVRGTDLIGTLRNANAKASRI